MKKAFAKGILKLFGWKVVDKYPNIPKSVCIMAPHTSMYDFVWGKLFFMTQGIKPSILIKSEMFTWYLKPFLKALGGIPVYRKHPIGLVDQMLEHFNTKEHFTLVITPEGTRKPVKVWKTGAIRIANAASVPIVMGKMDYEKKEMGLVTVYEDVPNDNKFMNQIKQGFIHVKAKHPEKFIADYEQ